MLVTLLKGETTPQSGTGTSEDGGTLIGVTTTTMGACLSCYENR